MRKMIFVLVIGGVLTAFVGCERAVENPIERGKYLVTIGACHECHTPKLQGPGGMPLPDTTRSLSGHPEGLPYPTWTPADIQERNVLGMANPMLTAWAGPWGVSFGTNLTPDTGTGIGEWTEQTFIQSIRTGKHQGQPNGRDILPTMPWQYMKHMTDNDLKAMWAYLRSIPPVNNQVPLPVPPSAPPMPEERNSARKVAEPQRDFLCDHFASSRLCVKFFAFSAKISLLMD